MSLKTAFRELALTPLMWQHSRRICFEGGSRLPSIVTMRQFAQARWFWSVKAIEDDTVSLALMEESRDSHLTGGSEQVCELRVSLCRVIARIN